MNGIYVGYNHWADIGYIWVQFPGSGPHIYIYIYIYVNTDNIHGQHKSTMYMCHNYVSPMLAFFQMHAL